MEIYQDWNPLMKFILNGIKILFSRVSSIIWVLNLNVETLYVWFINFDLLNQKVFLMENNKLILYMIKILFIHVEKGILIWLGLEVNYWIEPYGHVFIFWAKND